MTLKEEIYPIISIISIILISLSVSILVVTIHDILDRNDQRNNYLELWKFDETDGMLQLCTESTNTRFLYCKGDSTKIGMSLINRTQEQIQNFIDNCEKPVLTNDHYCIGEMIEINHGGRT